MPFRAELQRDGRTRFRLWPPSSSLVALQVDACGTDASYPLIRSEGEWHPRFIVETRSGGAMHVPDPARRFNPDGVQGSSELVDPHRYVWQTLLGAAGRSSRRSSEISENPVFATGVEATNGPNARFDPGGVIAAGASPSAPLPA